MKLVTGIFNNTGKGGFKLRSPSEHKQERKAINLRKASKPKEKNPYTRDMAGRGADALLGYGAVAGLTAGGIVGYNNKDFDMTESLIGGATIGGILGGSLGAGGGYLAGVGRHMLR